MKLPPEEETKFSTSPAALSSSTPGLRKWTLLSPYFGRSFSYLFVGGTKEKIVIPRRRPRSSPGPPTILLPPRPSPPFPSLPTPSSTLFHGSRSQVLENLRSLRRGTPSPWRPDSNPFPLPPLLRRGSRVPAREIEAGFPRPRHLHRDAVFFLFGPFGVLLASASCVVVRFRWSKRLIVSRIFDEPGFLRLVSIRACRFPTGSPPLSFALRALPSLCHVCSSFYLLLPLLIGGQPRCRRLSLTVPVFGFALSLQKSCCDSRWPLVL